MSELITVCIVIALLIAAWLAICIDNEKNVVKGVKLAIGLPFMVVVMVSAFVYVIYSFNVVIG